MEKELQGFLREKRPWKDPGFAVTLDFGMKVESVNQFASEWGTVPVGTMGKNP
jgi:hypothetical protein